jgi:hypothetical protein
MACDITISNAIGMSASSFYLTLFLNLFLNRKHCANRVHRIRCSLKMTHGKGKDFKKLPPMDPEKIGNGQYVVSILLCCDSNKVTITACSSCYSKQSAHGHMHRSYWRSLPKRTNLLTAQKRWAVFVVLCHGLRVF